MVNRVKRKIPLAFRGPSGDNSGKTKAAYRRIRQSLPWHNPLPYPHLYIWLVYPSHRQISVGGDEARVMQELLQRGGTSSLHTSNPNLKQVIRKMRRNHRLRIMQRTRHFRKRSITQYWLLDKVSLYLGLSEPVKGRKR